MGSVSTHQAAFTAIDSADFDAASPEECVDLLGHMRRLQGWLHAGEARLTSKLTEHHAAGQSAPAADTHTASSGVYAAGEPGLVGMQPPLQPACVTQQIDALRRGCRVDIGTINRGQRRLMCGHRPHELNLTLGV